MQRPYEPFLYSFDWGWAEAGGWSVRAYRTTGRAIRLYPGVGDALTALGPLLRPFITRWWTDKAAALNPDVEAARSVLEFEDFLFGRDRVALERIAEGLLDLQRGTCFYCHTPIGRNREIDHFIPWTYSGDDGIDNLVAACHRCNNSKRATLAGPEHLAEIIRRNQTWDRDLAALSVERRWPRDPDRTHRITRAAYLRSPGERPLWIRAGTGMIVRHPRTAPPRTRGATRVTPAPSDAADVAEQLQSPRPSFVGEGASLVCQGDRPPSRRADDCVCGKPVVRRRRAA